MQRFFLSALLLNVYAMAYTQTGDPTIQQDSLREVVVSATRSGSDPARVPEIVRSSRPAGPRSGLDRSTPELLLATPGAWVQKTNHGGGSVFLRGLTGNQTLILIDGIRLNNATFRYGPNQYLNTIDPFLLRNVEVLFGAGSVQYGSDAMGGAIHVLTAQPGFSTDDRNTTSGNIGTRLATHDQEQSLRGQAAYHAKKIAFQAGGTWRRFGDLRGGDTSGVQAPSGYREYALDLKGRFLPAANVELTVAHQLSRQNHVPLFHKVELENFSINEFDPQERQLTYLRGTWAPNRFQGMKNTCTLYRQSTEEGRNSLKNGSSTLRKENDAVETYGFLWQSDLTPNAHWTTQNGFDLYHDRVRSTRTDTDLNTSTENDQRGLYPNGATYLTYSAFSLHQWRFDGWVIDGGLRWSGYAIQLAEENLGNIRLNGAALVGKAGLLRQWGRRHAVFASAQSAFRAPNVDDMGTLGIVDFRYELPNYSLKPEKSWNFQVGYRLNTHTLRWQTAVFRNELRDLIARIRQDTQSIQGYPVYLKENQEKAYIHGLETEFAWRWRDPWVLEGSLAYTFGHNLTKQEPLRRIPPLNGRLALRFDKKTWFAGTEILVARQQDRLAAGDVADNRIPVGGTPGWVIFNVFAGFEWKHFALKASWQNLTNSDYRYHGSGINSPGSSGTMQLNWRW